MLFMLGLVGNTTMFQKHASNFCLFQKLLLSSIFCQFISIRALKVCFKNRFVFAKLTSEGYALQLQLLTAAILKLNSKYSIHLRSMFESRYIPKFSFIFGQTRLSKQLLFSAQIIARYKSISVLKVCFIIMRFLVCTSYEYALNFAFSRK